jgi:hypothetical protein
MLTSKMKIYLSVKPSQKVYIKNHLQRKFCRQKVLFLYHISYFSSKNKSSTSQTGHFSNFWIREEPIFWKRLKIQDAFSKTVWTYFPYHKIDDALSILKIPLL